MAVMTESYVIMKQFRGTPDSDAVTASVLADKSLSLGNSTAYILTVFQELFQVYACAYVCTFLNIKFAR
jgi:reverse gyrase